MSLWEAHACVRCVRNNLDCSLTENRTLCDASGELDRAGFELLIRHQLQLYVVRTLAAAMEKVERQQVQCALLFPSSLFLSLASHTRKRILPTSFSAFLSREINLSWSDSLTG